MKINTKMLEDAIKGVTAVTGSAEVQIVCNKELYVTSVNEGKYAKIVVDPKAKGKWKTRLLCGVLLEMVKKSPEVDLDMKNSSTLTVHAKNTSGTIKCMPWEETPKLDRKQGSTISDKVQIEITSALADVGITDIHEDGNSNFIFIEIGKKEMTVSRFDAYHMAFSEIEGLKSKESLKITAAVESFDTINRMAGKNSYKFSMDDSIKAWNDWFELQLPLIQSEGQQNMETVAQLIKSLKTKGGDFQVDKDEFFTALEKCAAVHETGSSVGVEGNGKSITLTIKTSYGQVKTKLEAKIKGKVNVRIDPGLVLDTLRPIKSKELHIRFDENVAFAKVKEDTRSSVYAFVLVK